MVDPEYEQGYRDGGSDVNFDWWYALNEEFGWNVYGPPEAVAKIRELLPEEP